MPIRVILNGSAVELEPGSTLQALVEERGLKPDRIAIERNGEIVGRAQWQQTALAEQDRVEIVHFVGGGCSPVRV